MKRKSKIELAASAVVALVVCVSMMVLRQSTVSSGDFYMSTTSLRMLDTFGSGSTQSHVQQVITENIQAELKVGRFEDAVRALRVIVSNYSGKVPFLEMYYENDRWTGNLDCKIPSENVSIFTFDVRSLIEENGKVTRISVTVREIEVNQTASADQLLSPVRIGLREAVEGQSAIVNQIGTVIPWLTTALVLMAEAVIVGVPLCLASLGVVLLFGRGIVPMWRRQLKKKRVEASSE